MASPLLTSTPVTSSRRHSRLLFAAGFLALSALYFADTLLRATLKTFWYDELISVLLCRLPSLHDTWSAVLAGADFNPPVFYALTWSSQHLFGEGLIASRLPSILGFWIFAISLYTFVRRRLGVTAALVAALFPVFTLAHVYAYEARAHGLVLGFCGLMLVTWQRARESRARSWWTLAFALSTLAAMLTHVYVAYLLVPFFLVEALALRAHWRVRPGILAALLLPCAAVAPLYARMTRSYRSVTTVGGLHVHPYEVLQQYLVSMLAPALIVLLIALLGLVLEQQRAGRRDPFPPAPAGCLTPPELALAIGLACLPIFGAIGVKLNHGPFFNRYFLAGSAGYALLLAQALATRSRRSLAARTLVTAMVCLLAADTAVAAFCRWHHADLDQIEPASRFHFPPDPHRPLERNDALLRDHGSEPILVPSDHTYLYLYYYAPSLRDRLALALPPDSQFSVDAYQREARLLRTPDMHAVSLSDFLRTHEEVAVYSALDARENGSCVDCLETILRTGQQLRSVDRDDDGRLEHYSR